MASAGKEDSLLAAVEDSLSATGGATEALMASARKEDSSTATGGSVEAPMASDKF